MQDPKIAQNLPSRHHCTTLSGYIVATKACIDNRKKLLNSSISSTCIHNMVNFSPLWAQIVSLVWGTPANFNGFRVLLSLLQQRRLTEANQTFHDVWPSPGLVHYIWSFGGSCPVTEFCQVQHSLASKSCVLLFWQRYSNGTLLVGVSQSLRRWAEGTTYNRQGGHHVEH